MAAIDQFAQSWFRWIVASSWQLALLIVVVSVLVVALRKASPKLRHALWLLVLVKVFLPPTLALPTGIGSWGLGGLSDSAEVTERLMETIGAAEAAPDPQAEFTETEQADVAATGPSIALLLMLVWGIGAILFWVMVAIRYQTLAHAIRGTPAIDEGPLRVAMERSAIALGIDHSPELRVTDALTSPFLFGVVHPCVVLPKQFVSDATDDELSAVLTHELVHLRRRDTWIGWLQVVAQGLFWFHPFMWWASRQLRHEREEACDESVLQDGGIAPVSYGESMMRVLTSAKARSLADGSLIGVFERGTNLQIRLEQIMNFKATKKSFGWLSKIAVVCAAAILLPMASGVSEPLDAQDTRVARATPAGESTPYPQIVKTIPKVGATEVRTSMKAIRVTFDRDMSKGMSWTGGPPLFPPTDSSQKARWIDNRTCILPVKLERGKFYRVGINSKSYQNFQSTDGTPTPPIAIYFATQGAPPDVVARAKTPEIVKLSPANGASNVDPNIKSISVTFNMPMGGGMSWTGGGENFPAIPSGAKPKWSRDKLTCRLPVKLKSSHSYRLGLNSRSHNNFQSDAGVPLQPVVYEFKTK